MISISELFLLGLSLGTLNNWSKNTNGDPAYSQSQRSGVPQTESKSLYDLMAHFPTADDINCNESDSRFRYPGKCSHYITCRDYHPHIRQCPPGMYFDDDSQQCRLAMEVNCIMSEQAPTSCNEDEEYSDCGCDKSCRNMYDEEMCVNYCDRGCFCRSGYVRDDDGNCIDVEACENSLHSIFSNNADDFF